MRILLAFGLTFAAALAAGIADDIEYMRRTRSPSIPRPLPPALQTLVPPRHPIRGRVVPADGVVRDDFVCNDDLSSGCNQNGPDIDVAEDGSFAVGWLEFRDGDADAWFQRFDTAGNPVGSNERLNDDVSLGWQGDPSAAVGPDGVVMYTWEDRRDIGNSDVFAQRFDGLGNRLGGNFRVSDSTAAGDQDISSCRFVRDGTALVAWDDRRNGITGDIYAQFLMPDGSPRGVNFRVNDDGVGMANQYEPEVGCDTLSRFCVVWMDGRGLNSSDWNIFGQRFNPDGSRAGGNFQVTTNDSIQWNPRVGVSPAGSFVVSWDDRRRHQWDVYAQFYNDSGRQVGVNVRVSDDAGTADQAGCDAAANRYGEYLVVWTDRRNGHEDIYGQRYGSNGSPVGANFRVNDDAGTANQGAPSAAARPDGGYEVVWADAREGNLDIYGQRLTRTGAPVGGNYRVNDDSGSAQQRVSSIGMSREGRTLVGWEDERNGGTDIYSCLLDSSGASVGPNVRLNDDAPGGAGQYYTAVAGGRDRFVAAWVDERVSIDIYARFLDRSGQPAGPSFLVNSDGGSAHQWYPYCAMDAFNRSVIAWMDTRNSNYHQVFVRRYDSSGSPAGPEFTASDTTAPGYYASVAAGPDGRFVAAWMDPRLGEMSIYCQLFRADGTRVGPSRLVNTDGTDHYHGYPACAMDREGRFVVAWEDTRVDYDVVMQWFDSTGAPLGENERVTDSPLGSIAYSPSCAFDPSGRLAVMFNDEREIPGCPQILCQRFGQDRARIGLNRKVNNPNLFPNNSHWTVGQSIAAGTDRLAFAWTDNRRHLGFDIFGKITDWELVGTSEPAASRPLAVRRAPSIIRRGAELILGSQAEGVRVYDAGGRRVVCQDGGRLQTARLGRGAYWVQVGSGGTRKVLVQ